jgi:type I restriction enzyme S subunit
MSKPWPMVRLEKLLIPVTRSERVDPLKEYRLLGVRLDGGGPFLRETVLGSQSSAKSLSQVKAGDFIYSRLFACRGAFGIIDKELDGCFVSGEFPTFLPKEGVVDNKFLRYWFRLPATIHRVDADCTGSTPLTRNRFKEHFFLALDLPLPPLSEQRRIVARIEELAAKIEEAKGLRDKTVAGLAALLRSRISEVFGALRWTHKSFPLEDLANSITDGDHLPPPKAENGIPFIFISNIASGRLDLKSTKFVSREYFASLDEKRVPRRGDVLYAAVGSYGIPCVVDVDADFCFQRHIAIIKPNRTKVHSQYLKWALESPDVFEQATAKATGSAQLTVPLKAIRQLALPLPPIEQQKIVAAEIDSFRAEMDATQKFQTETQAALDALLPSILDRAFKGEL